jgi:hypothetical protein
MFTTLSDLVTEEEYQTKELEYMQQNLAIFDHLDENKPCYVGIHEGYVKVLEPMVRQKM